LEDAKKHYKSLLDKILIALEHAKTDGIKKIKELDIPMWNMVLQKILSIYYPDKFLTIDSPDVIITCAKELQLEEIDLSSTNSIQINYECKKALSSLPEYSSWSYEKLGTFIWEIFIKRERKVQIINNIGFMHREKTLSCGMSFMN
jgi:5-methylcytosine-specific restriction protein B